MARQPQRIVEAATIDGIGPISARELLAMPEDSWGVLRDRITDRRYGKDGLVARCMKCGYPVFIKPAPFRGPPMFQHYSGSDPRCPWYQGRNIVPNDARAAQYQGQQESVPHRLMCEQIAQIVALDQRHIRHTVEQYLPPTENDYGRFPDVYVEWEGFGPFAIEFQLSNTFQTEISQRCKHYEYEGIPLLWVLYHIDTLGQVKQSFRDVIRRHRGNAFVLDQAAVKASYEQRTLMLTCHLRRGDSFDPPILVRFDELTIPRSRLPYYQDRIVAPRVAEIEKRRRPWFDALDAWDRHEHLDLYYFEDRYKGDRLVAAAFSIVAAANGKERNYASDHPNIRAMLNTYLHTGTLAPYAALLTRLLETTAQRHLLRTKVGDHLRRVTVEQVGEDSREWRLLRKLLPEALDPLLREELTYFDALPDWARPSAPP